MIFKKFKEFSGHAAGVYSLAFDGNYIYSASADKFVTRWKIQEGVQDKFAIKFENPVYSICLIRNNEILAVGLSTGGLHLFNLEDRKEIKFYQQHLCSIFALTENSHKQHLYAADSDGNISVWSTKSLDLLMILPLACGKIRRISIDSEGDRMSVCSQDGTLRVFDTTFFNEINAIRAHEGGVTCALFHPLRNDYLLSGGKDAFIRLWDLTTGEQLLSIPAHNYVIYDLISLNEGKMMVSASRDKTIKVWDLETVSFLQKLDVKAGGHRHSVNCLQTLGNDSFVSGSDDKRIVLWEDSTLN